MKLKNISILAGGIFGLISATSAFANGPQYQVKVTNITKGQSFTPILTVAHSSPVSLFTLGEPASEEIAAMAEAGNIAPLRTLVEGSSSVSDTASSQGLLGPGESTVMMVTGSYNDMRVSMAAMLLPTNDTFMAIDSVRVPYNGSVVAYAKAYDAGSETNDELCASIPGPLCGGEPLSPNDDGEGFVHISSGIHGVGDLGSAAYDWRDAVAKVEIQIIY
ncbi:spondin domain-containing protein [Agarilytica rhodophyticola]|uniref:spondin domain-containing protein n=1 Tax=Agarilytica rhodophyticola TaxID=1737490 RepID=UPI0013156A5F|nr:spondin domain-containing protein [Agarilytica rhodophyticola]